MPKATAIMILLCFVSLSASATLISYWDFNSNIPAGNTNWAQPISSSTSNGSLSYTYPALRAGTGTTLNSTDSVYGSSLHIPLANPLTDHNYRYLDLSLSTVGYHNLSLSFASTRSAGAFSSAAVSYSTDGTNFTPRTTLSFANTDWALFTIDFSGVSAVEDISSLKIRIVTSGATQVNKIFRYDNIQITGDPITLPVEFSGMTVSPGIDNNAYISWTTQSETGVNGYYVLRGFSEDLNQAGIISPLIQAANSSTTQTYFFADADLTASGLYFYWLQALDYNGETGYFGPQILTWSPGDPANPSAPLKTGLSTLYPNPFNPSLTIDYALEESSPTQIRIYNLRGQAVRSIDIGGQITGEHKMVWNGRNDRGEQCPTGVYRVVMSSGKVIDSRKVLLLK
ncbi:MAG TPA: FlgD immunoglobulin-like domain containing protein [Candidatus Cloacimonadota bacterium]|nr:FlgD immunoglobulin-like domain containing protein [Candidatus Cloacimonadota bacterium]